MTPDSAIAEVLLPLALWALTLLQVPAIWLPLALTWLPLVPWVLTWVLMLPWALTWALKLLLLR